VPAKFTFRDHAKLHTWKWESLVLTKAAELWKGLCLGVAWAQEAGRYWTTCPILNLCAIPFGRFGAPDPTSRDLRIKSDIQQV
jgi:hypothetical protein